jgi:uncharacterized protein
MHIGTIALFAALLGAAIPAVAQVTEVRPISGTRLDVVVSGDITRVPDIVRVNVGVSTDAPSAIEAIRLNGEKMDRLRAALTAAGIAPGDLQTSSVHLDANYRHRPNEAPVFLGYGASHSLSVLFRDAARAGRILDTLVQAGATDISGVNFEVSDEAAALDEARVGALEAARARADLYARSLGMRVARVLAVSESSGYVPASTRRRAPTRTDMMSNMAFGVESVAVSLTVSFELE